jgi:hypothetical protein
VLCRSSNRWDSDEDYVGISSAVAGHVLPLEIHRLDRLGRIINILTVISRQVCGQGRNIPTQFFPLTGWVLSSIFGNPK